MTEETKAQIQRVALEMFMKQGYEATYMDAVADAAGVTKPAVYYYFDSKQALFLELLDGLFTGLVTEYMRAVEGMPTLRDALEYALASTADLEDALGSDGAGIDTGYMSLVMDAARRFPDQVGGRLDGFYAEMRSLVVARAVEARDAGEIRPDVDLDALALAVVALIEGLLLVGSLAPSCDHRGHEAALMDVIWNGVATRTE